MYNLYSKEKSADDCATETSNSGWVVVVHLTFVPYNQRYSQYLVDLTLSLGSLLVSSISEELSSSLYSVTSCSFLSGNKFYDLVRKEE